jgi:hypothetical protein
MMRARVMPFILTSFTTKQLPAINAEGPYDAASFYPDASVPNPDVDKRYRVRQAGYLSGLSNAVGFSYGAHGLTAWDQPKVDPPGEPSLYFGLGSAFDMGRLKSNLWGRHLVAHPDWIVDGTNSTVEKYKMVLAADEVSFVMAYLPGDQDVPGQSSVNIKIYAKQVPCLVCTPQPGSAWSITWVNPVTNLSGSGSCSGPTDDGRITFQRPLCDNVNNPSCDWLLKLEKTGTCASAMSTTENGEAVLQAWSDMSAADGSSAIYAGLTGPSGQEEPILLSPAGKAFQVAPRVGRAGGYHLVVWQADGLDGSLYGVYGALLGPRKEVTGPFKINHYTEHDQREPAVAGSIRGEALVVWSSYGQDGDRGGIFGRLVKVRNRGEDPSQDQLGEELEISEERAEDQQSPQILADAKGFWVVWETVDGNGLSRGLSLRRLGLDGHPEAPEVLLPAEVGEQRKLLTLDNPTPESVVIRWWRQDARGGILEKLQQEVGPHGVVGPVTRGNG